ncbi:MAG: CBS domain-containing protein [Oscillospiraceae bacterium]|jgi:CBS domain-containing protein|nr:CBS domain-containing protein [Oscillospiraceae bacterium]
MLVSELMSSHVISVLPDETASSAARLLDRHNIGALPVCARDGRLYGIVTDRDIVLRCVAAESDPEQTRVREIMSRGVVGVAPGEDVREATRLMAERQVRRLPVVEDGRVVGMLALGDLARRHQFDMEASKALSEISANLRAR